ncbi:TPA: hypothetical protein ACH3X1_010494 [Trebouxia sp. C0004]
MSQQPSMTNQLSSLNNQAAGPLIQMRGLTRQHLPVLEFLNSVGLFERSCWEKLDYLFEGISSGEVDFAVSPCQHSGKATTGKGRSAATRKDQSIGRPATIGAAAARCSPNVTISSSAAAKTSAQMTARDAHPDVHEDGSYQSSDDSEGPHKQIRHEDLETLKKTRARMVKNHNRQSRVRSFQVGDCVGVKVDRADRGHCDRKFVPCLIIG